jgi:hypothetical protein
MMRFRISLALAAALWAVGSLGAADLRQIERTIAKEPAYKNKPKYCLLVFGEQARTRVWLVQDGDVLYVDRNANGDLTEKDERITLKPDNKDFRTFEAGDIHDGSLTHTGLNVMHFRVSAGEVGNLREMARIIGHSGGEPWAWTMWLAAERPADDKRHLPKRITYIVNTDGRGYLLFADRPADAPIIHFNGPWTLGLQDLKQHLTAGQKSRLTFGVGTPGLRPGTFSFVCYPDTIPADAYPVADITFPPKSKGEKPIRRKYTFKDRC